MALAICAPYSKVVNAPSTWAVRIDEYMAKSRGRSEKKALRAASLEKTTGQVESMSRGLKQLGDAIDMYRQRILSGWCM